MDLSYWAFEQLASTNWGVIPVRWRPVPCTSSTSAGMGVKLDNLVQSTWLGLRILNSNFAVRRVEVADAEDAAADRWHAMENPWVRAPLRALALR